MSARKSRTRAAVVAAELKESNAVDAVAWPARLDSRWANGLAIHSCPFSEAGSPDALNMANRVA
eukprot:1962927-Pleurochrysis_carterae.AAC.1